MMTMIDLSSANNNAYGPRSILTTPAITSNKPTPLEADTFRSRNCFTKKQNSEYKDNREIKCRKPISKTQFKLSDLTHPSMQTKLKTRQIIHSKYKDRKPKWFIR